MGDLETTLPTDIETGDADHAGKHNDVNDQVNFLTGQVVDLLGAVDLNTEERARHLGERAHAVVTATDAEALPGASVGATSAAGAASTIGGAVHVSAIAGAVPNPIFRWTRCTPIQAGAVYPNDGAVKSSGLTSTNGMLDIAAEFIYDQDTFDVVWIAKGVDKTMRVWADDILVGSWAGAAADGSIRRNLVTLPDARQRVIRVEFFGGDGFLGIAREAAATVAYPSTKRKGARLVFLADSYGEGTGTTEKYNSLPNYLGRLLGIHDVLASGSGGTGLDSLIAGRVRYGDRVVNDYVNQGVDIGVIWGSVNDSDKDPATVGAKLGTLLDTVIAGRPNTLHVVCGPIWPASPALPAMVAVSAAMQAAAVARGVYFIDPIAEEWITGTGDTGAPAGDGNADLYIGADGVHPSTAGHKYLARRLAGHILALG